MKTYQLIAQRFRTHIGTFPKYIAAWSVFTSVNEECSICDVTWENNYRFCFQNTYNLIARQNFSKILSSIFISQHTLSPVKK